MFLGPKAALIYRGAYFICSWPVFLARMARVTGTVNDPLLDLRASKEKKFQDWSITAVKQIAFAILAPTIAILTAAALQPLLVVIVPRIQSQAIAMVSLDSYFEIIASLVLSFCAACLFKRRTASRGLRIASFVAPVACLAFVFASMPLAFSLNVSTGMSALRAVLWMTAVAPLFGTGLAFALVSSNVHSGTSPR